MQNPDRDYTKEYDKLEKDYNKFYQIEVETIKLYYIYINEYNEIYNIKYENEMLDNTYLTNERLLYLIKNNQYNLLNKHKLVNLLQYNIELEQADLKNFLLDKIQCNYLKSLPALNTIKFNKSIKILQDLNSVIFIYKVLSPSHNTTKKIILKPNNTKTKTRRK
jgi:hypothetical protein